MAHRTEQDWNGLLGTGLERVRELVSAECGDDADTVATRIWCALECLRKTGSATRALTLAQVQPDGWVVLSDGDVRIATWVTTLNGYEHPVVFAVLSE